MALDLFPPVLVRLPVPSPVFYSLTISPTTSLPFKHPEQWQPGPLSLSISSPQPSPLSFNELA